MKEVMESAMTVGVELALSTHNPQTLYIALHLLETEGFLNDEDELSHRTKHHCEHTTVNIT